MIQELKPELVQDPYAWIYTNSQGARVLHLEPSARLDADKQAAATYPNHHKCIPSTLTQSLLLRCSGSPWPTMACRISTRK